MVNRFVPSPPLRRSGAARTALLDPIVGYTGYSRQQSAGFVRTLSMQDRVLVVLIENGGVDLGIPELADKIIALAPGGSLLPDSIRAKLVDFLRDKIKSLTDSLLENAELSLNRYTAAKGSTFGDVVVLRDGTASYDELKTQLINLTRAGKLIDIVILTHGSNDYISVTGGINGQKIRDMKTANGGPLSIRMVYMMNCVGSSLNQAWIDAGARASSGSRANNYLPEPTMYFFWQNWQAGKEFEAAATSAYRKTVNLMNDAVNGFIASISPLASLAFEVSLESLDFVAGSAPVISGARTIAITTDDLSTAKSLSSSLATTVLPINLLSAMSDAPATIVAPRKLSSAGLDFIKGFETFRAKLHNNEYGHCAIGYGTRLHDGPCDGRPVEEPYANGISEEQATELLARHLDGVQACVNEAIRVAVTQNQDDALVSFVSEIGGNAFEKSTLLRLLNAGNFAAVPDEMRKWTRARRNGVVTEQPSLVKRRAAEAELFARANAPSMASSMSVSRSFTGIDYTIPGAFEIIAQPTPNTCWAAVFTMMYCWHNSRSTDIPSALATVGDSWVDMYKHDTALDANLAQFLYDAAGLVALSGFNPTIDGWVTLLKKYGPLYVDVGYNTGAMTHAIIVTGIAGDGTPSGTSITYVDPVGGNTVTMKFQDFLAKFEAKSAVQWPYTIVHWPPALGADATLSISHSSVYSSPSSLLRDRYSQQFNPAAIIAGIEVADAAQIGLAAVSIVQSQVAATQGSFSLAFDKAERLLNTEARQAMPGVAKAGKSKYQRLVLHIPNAHPTTANADIVVRWEGSAYGEIGTVMIERDLANSSEWSKSSANIVMTWVHQIPTDGVDPRAWPIVYKYSGTVDPLGNGYFEFEGEFEIDAFGGIKFNKHAVYSRSLSDWVLKHDTAWYIQRGPDVATTIPNIPQDQLDYLKKHLP
jgi:GH24 family phage-related lysozyme (muramidase)